MIARAFLRSDLVYGSRSLGARLHNWHSGMDSIYAVGSMFAAGEGSPLSDAESALESLKRIHARRKQMRLKPADVRELNSVIADLQHEMLWSAKDEAGLGSRRNPAATAKRKSIRSGKRGGKRGGTRTGRGTPTGVPGVMYEGAVLELGRPRKNPSKKSRRALPPRTATGAFKAGSPAKRRAREARRAQIGALFSEGRHAEAMRMIRGR